MRKGGVVAVVLMGLACSEPTDTVKLAGPGAKVTLSSSAAGRYIVLFKGRDLPVDADKIVSEAGGTSAALIPQLSAIAVTSSDPDFAAKVARHKSVEAAGPDMVISVNPPSINAFANAQQPGSQGPAEPPGRDPQRGSEPLYNQQWDKMRMNASDDGSYAVQRGREDVFVGVLDTGAEVLPVPHPDIAPNLDFARSRSFLNLAFGTQGNPNPVEWDDKHGHGSWCASAVAAPINQIGISGVAPRVKVVALKVAFDNGDVSLISAAFALIYAANNHLDAVSMSFGGYATHTTDQPIITFVQRAIDYARSNGVTPVAALGNDNFNLSDGNFFQSYIEVPGELPGVIGVSATGYYNRKAYYSNYGVGKADITAPGGAIFEQMPPPPYGGFGGVLGAWSSENLGGWPGFLLLPNRPGTAETCTPGTGTGPCFMYAYLHGTSMSTPNAAGVVALIISQYGDFGSTGGQKPHMSPQQVESILQRTANNQPCVDNRFLPPNEDLNAYCQGTAGGYTSFFGKGIVDAFKAVTDGPGSGAADVPAIRTLQ
ncbi:MAG TPA: S8 family serine peptidase [Gemmatimonadaceae bacterium]|nr:S8 family serine peptidase [Gemmatimonadaceae bacterium]